MLIFLKKQACIVRSQNFQALTPAASVLLGRTYKLSPVPWSYTGETRLPVCQDYLKEKNEINAW